MFRGPKKSTTAKATTFALASLATLFALTSPIAFQDVTALLKHHDFSNRWQAFSVPSPIGSAHAATIGFMGSKEQLKVGVDAGAAIAKAAVAADASPTAATSSDTAELAQSKASTGSTFDEFNVSMAAKGPRLFKTAAAMTGRIARASARQPRVVGGWERIRAAFRQVTPVDRAAIRLAANFQLLGPPRIAPLVKQNRSPAEVQLASLDPSITGDVSSAVDQTNALGYAGASASKDPGSLFETILKDQPQAFIPPVSGDDHSWAATALPKSSYTASEQKCLAEGIYFEARGEPTMGEAAVGQVILNRVRNPAYPKTICGVVFQNKNWRNHCQFSFACDGKSEHIADQNAWDRSKRIAELVTKGEIWINEVGSATHYHADYVQPRWASAMEEVDTIGKHIFYRTYDGGL